MHTFESLAQMLEALDEETKCGLFGAQSGATLPEFYNKTKNQCPEGGECYEANKIDKGNGAFRRVRLGFTFNR